MLKWLVSLVDTSKLAGVVRAGAASVLTVLAAKYLGGKISPDMITTLAAGVATAVVGLWSIVAKKADPDYK